MGLIFCITIQDKSQSILAHVLVDNHLAVYSVATASNWVAETWTQTPRKSVYDLITWNTRTVLFLEHETLSLCSFRTCAISRQNTPFSVLVVCGIRFTARVKQQTHWLSSLTNAETKQAWAFWFLCRHIVFEHRKMKSGIIYFDQLVFWVRTSKKSRVLCLFLCV